jgi:hypothetical protein
VSYETIYVSLFVQCRGALRNNSPAICGPVTHRGDLKIGRGLAAVLVDYAGTRSYQPTFCATTRFTSSLNETRPS